MDDFDEYVTARSPALLRFAYLLTGDSHLAEDLVQEGLIRCHLKWRRIRRRGEPDSYVRKAILRQFLSWRRRRAAGERAFADLGQVPERTAGRPGPGSASASFPASADELGRVTDRAAMWRLLAGLSRMQRAVLVLRFYEDLPDDRIAALLGCSLTTVRVHAHRALERLRTAPELEEAAVGLAATGKAERKQAQATTESRRAP